MILLNEVKRNTYYRMPGSYYQVELLGTFAMDSLCFCRAHDRALYYGREFTEYQDGELRLNLEEVDDLNLEQIKEELKETRGVKAGTVARRLWNTLNNLVLRLEE